MGRTASLWRLPLAAALALGLVGTTLAARPTGAQDASVEDVVTDLATIWAIDFAPDGRIFLTERGGRVRTVSGGQLDPEPWMTLEVVEVAESGLLGLALDPDFGRNGYVYVAYTYATGNGGMQNRLVRLREDATSGRGVFDAVLLDDVRGARVHDGGRVKLGPNGKLYWTMGEAGTPDLAQRTDGAPRDRSAPPPRRRPVGAVRGFPGSRRCLGLRSQAKIWGRVDGFARRLADWRQAMIQTIGILSPGDMGAAIGQALRSRGLRVVAALESRSARTRQLAAEAGIEDVGSVERMVEAADAVLSVLVPAEAVAAAERVAAALRSVRTSVLYADLNAVAPATTRRVGQVVEAAGARFVDGGIIGPPPRGRGTRVYVSGQHAPELAALGDQVIEVIVVGDEIGQASGLKMCYAALTKGLIALGTELLVTAHRLELEGPLRAELENSQQALLAWLTRSIPTMPPKAHRWVGEMEEIAATFEGVGLTPRTLLGAADMYRWIAETPLGHETPESRDGDRGLDGTIAALAGEVPVRAI